MSKAQLLRAAAAAPLMLTAFASAARAETVASVTQLSYDAEERVQCTAVRMNPAAFTGSLPDACTLGTQGSNGPDRITKNTYDAAGQVTQVQRAYGTPLQETYAAYTYSQTGKQTGVTDANGNKASFTYDGYDRLTQWNFPDKTTVGTVSTTDYEAYGYDADGNRTSLRKRDGQTIVYGYDTLNRVTHKGGPAVTDVDYTYDLAGNQLTATYSTGGKGITNAYNALGQLTSSTNNMGTTVRTLNYQYDVAGNRSQLTYPDSSFFTYGYDGLNRLTTIKEAGATAIASTIFDAQGRVGSQTRGAVTTTLVYDAVSRPQSWTDDLAGTASDVTSTFGYNPANQITSKNRSNDSYAYTGYLSVNRPYSVNGLNQYTAAGPASFTYDANGNLIGDGSNSYGYDVENRLTSATIAGAGAVAIKYDPNGRLWQVIWSDVTIEYTHDGDSIVMEVNGPNTYRYVHGPGADDPMFEYTNGANRYSYQADYQGSIVSVADATGATIRINSYDEYGISSSSNYGRFQYTGQAWLARLGLYYYKARMYSPTLGRFMQTDPVGYKDQINLYAYVGNDPTDNRDPSGLWTCDECTKNELKVARAFIKGMQYAANSKGASADLKSVVASLGKEGDKGNNVSFSNLAYGTLGQQQGSQMTLDLAQIRSAAADIAKSNGVSSYYALLAVGASVTAHEQRHYYDRFSEGGLDHSVPREKSAYRTQDEVMKAFGLYGMGTFKGQDIIDYNASVHKRAWGSCEASAAEVGLKPDEAVAKCTNQ